MKMKKFAAILTAVTMVLSGAVTANAMLSEDEQRAAYIEKAVKEALSAQTEAQEKTETEETEKQTEKQETESETEALTETEKESESESEAETEAETETETETETEAQGKTDKILVAIDPAHQGPGADLEDEEPIGPGAEEIAKGFSEGTKGVVSGLNEYELNLSVAKAIKKELEERGYEVYLTREDHDAQLSEVQRAELVNASGAQILISLHGNSSGDSDERGVMVQAPSYDNPYIEDDIVKKSNALADLVMEAYCEETGMTSRGLYNIDNSLQINWSQIPVMVLELGYMSNAQDDAYMAEEENYQKMAEGIADGVDLYFGRV